MVSIPFNPCSSAANSWTPALYLGITLCLVSPMMGQESETPTGVSFDESFEMWPVDLSIKGTVILAGSSVLPEGTMDYFLTLANRRLGRRKIEQELPSIVHLSPAYPSNNGAAGGVEWPEDYGVPMAKLSEIDNKILSNADGVWLTADGPLTDVEAIRLAACAPQLTQFIGMGGVMFADSNIAPWLGALRLLPGKRLPSAQDGLNLIPDCVLMTDFKARDEPQLLSLLSVAPRSVGVGIPAGGLLVLSGRKLRAYGERSGTLLIAANLFEPVKRKELEVSVLGRRRLNPYRQMADLTAWRRHAIDRTSEVFPPAEPPAPYVAKGALVIVGGGGMPEGLMQRFIEMAGGPEAHVVYVPCAEQDQV
ncbi:MAG: hypothetical protein MK106_15450, partial [Mariniblastus sp.]|nr:hypothetical protein [Mariniblastus sp.]